MSNISTLLEQYKCKTTPPKVLIDPVKNEETAKQLLPKVYGNIQVIQYLPFSYDIESQNTITGTLCGEKFVAVPKTKDVGYVIETETKTYDFTIHGYTESSDDEIFMTDIFEDQPSSIVFSETKSNKYRLVQNANNATNAEDFDMEQPIGRDFNIELKNEQYVISITRIEETHGQKPESTIKVKFLYKSIEEYRNGNDPIKVFLSGIYDKECIYDIVEEKATKRKPNEITLKEVLNMIPEEMQDLGKRERKAVGKKDNECNIQQIVVIPGELYTIIAAMRQKNKGKAIPVIEH